MKISEIHDDKNHIDSLMLCRLLMLQSGTTTRTRQNAPAINFGQSVQQSQQERIKTQTKSLDMD